MDYTIKAKPTTYKGIKFRSKLEAQWAAFFDLVNIKWLYEPEKFNQWEPDFLIYGQKPIYVEVKPFLTEDIITEYKVKCRDIYRSPDAHVILITTPIGSPIEDILTGETTHYSDDMPPIGVELLYFFDESDETGYCEDGYDFIFWKDNFDFSCYTDSWDGIIGTSKSRKYWDGDFEKYESLWAKAQNIIQTKITRDL